jgi:hypothetical protein
MNRIILGAALMLATGASAQAPTLMAGSRLRVYTDAGRSEGTLMAQTGDSLTIAESGAVRRVIPFAAVSRIQASAGKSHGSGAIKGAKIGAVIGGGLGVLVGLAISTDGSCTGSGCDSAPITLGLIEAAGGALWGLAIGGAVGAEKWETVYPKRYGVSGGALPGQARLGLSIRY